MASPVDGFTSLLKTALFGDGTSLNFPICFKTSFDCGPDILITATPHLPCPEDSENTVFVFEDDVLEQLKFLHKSINLAETHLRSVCLIQTEFLWRWFIQHILLAGLFLQELCLVKVDRNLINFILPSNNTADKNEPCHQKWVFVTYVCNNCPDKTVNPHKLIRAFNMAYAIKILFLWHGWIVLFPRITVTD